RHTRCYRDWSSDVCSSDLFNRLVWIGRTAHKDTQFMAYLRLHRAERLRQQLSSIRFDLDSVAPFRTETAKMPVGKELCIAIEARSEERRVGKEERIGWWWY